MKRIKTICVLSRNRYVGLLTLLMLLLGASTSQAQTPTFSVSDSLLEFTARVGDSTSASLTITTSSNATVPIHWYFGGTNWRNFTIDGSYGDIAMPNASTPVTLTISFQPWDTQDYDGTLVLSDSIGNYRKEIHLVGHGRQRAPHPLEFDGTGQFGAVSLNTSITRRIMLINQNGDSAFTIHSIALKNGTVFTLHDAGTTPGTLSGRDQHEVDITFTPTTEGYAIDTMLVTYDDYENVSHTAVLGLSALGRTFQHFSGIEIATDSVFYPIPYDRERWNQLTISHSSDDSVTLEQVTLTGDTNFSLYPSTLQLPVVMTSRDPLQILVHFASGQDLTKASYTATLHVQMTGGGQTITRDVIYHATAFDSTKEKFVYLDAGVSDTIRFKGNKNKTVDQTIIFFNSHDSAIHVRSVGLKDGTNFTATVLYPQGSFPLTISSYDALYVNVKLTNSGTGPFKDKLIIVTDNNLMSLEYDLEASPVATDGVMISEAKNAELLAQPNPSSGPVNFTIADAVKAKITVYDLLGNAVYSQESVNGHWTWSGYTTNGSRAASGVYLIRAEGLKKDGSTLHTSARVMLAP